MNAPQPERPDLLEVVYYSHPVPRNPAVLTVLGLIFDRIHFPGVTMPPNDFDEKVVTDEIRRIASLPIRADPNTKQLLDCMGFAAQLKHVSDFCIFPAQLGARTALEEGVNDVIDQLELMAFGPRPEGEIPVRVAGPWIKGFQGAEDEERFVFCAPDTITYPANALLYP